MNLSMIEVETLSDHGGKSVNHPKMIVVHAMCEYLVDRGIRKHAITFLDGIGLSAHILVNSVGVAFRCRRDDWIAFHAKGFNTDSLGIEILVPGETADYSDFIRRIDEKGWCSLQQFDSVVDVCRRWRKLHDIDTIKRHSDVSPGRKRDPGNGFDWGHFLREVMK